MSGKDNMKELIATQKPEQVEDSGASGLLGDFWRSIVSGAEIPYNSGAEFVNHVAHRKVMNQLHLADAPHKVDDPWSARGLLEGTGTLLGMLPSFWLTNRAIGGLGGLA